MRSCPNCGHTNMGDVPICSNCGRPLVQYCHSCGNWVQAGTDICPRCGEPIKASSPASLMVAEKKNPWVAMNDSLLKNLRDSIPIVLARKIENIASKMVGQRREVTVLDVGVVNITKASQSLNIGEASWVIDSIMHRLADIIYEFEGTIDRLTGDTLMALFGLPVNHENDSERAVRAALEMLNTIAPLREKLRQEYDLEINIRMGINTGLVIAGNLGNQHHMEYTVIGDTVNLASHLENFAESGTTLVSFRTYQRTYPTFIYSQLPDCQIKDYPAPVQAFRPLSVRSTVGRIRGLPGLQVPMIGREKDLHRLGEVFSKVTERKRSQVVLLSGEAGIGKTRFVAEFCHTLDDQPVKIYLGSCASYMRITPYRVVADILRNILHVSEMDTDDVQREALSYYLEQLNLEHQDLLPYLVSVLGISQADSLAEIRLKLLDPSMLQRQIHSALRSFFFASALRSTTILIFDDLHWIDPASRDFLIYFMQTLDETPILLILIARDFSDGANTRPLVSAAEKRGQDFSKFHLEPLSSPDSRNLMDQLLCATSSEASLVKDQIVSRAFGNPYYAEELVRILLDNGGLVRQEGGWTVTDSASKLVQEVPGTLQDIILARFDFLAEELKDTLQRSAVLRSAFGINLLRKITDQDEGRLLENLKALENRGFLERTLLGNEEAYSFKHPLLQETIYNTLVKRDLRPLHLRIAEAIEDGFSSLQGEQSDILAYHYSESTLPFKAIPYLIASAENASQRFANETVVQYYRKALELMESSPEVMDERIAQVQIGLARALKYLGDFEEALRILETASSHVRMEGVPMAQTNRERAILYMEGLRERADIHGREGKLERAIELLQQGFDFWKTAGPEQYLIQGKRLADRLAWVYFRQGKLKEALNTANQALKDEQAWESEDPITLASLYNTLGGVHWMRSNYKKAIECVERSLGVYRSLNYLWGMAVAYTNLGVLQYSAGEWSKVITNLEQADMLHAQSGYLVERPTNLKNMGELLISMGEFELARQKFETSLEISKRFGMSISIAYAEIGLCRLSILEEKTQEAKQHLEKAKRLLNAPEKEIDDRILQLYLLEASIDAETGEYTEGLGLANKAYKMALDGGFPVERNEALRILGTLQTRAGKFEKAEENLKKAIHLSQKQADRDRQAQALVELSQLYVAWAQSDPSKRSKWLDQATEALQTSITLFTSLGANHHLTLAQNSLAQISSVLG